MVHLDLAIDRADFPVIKRRFNPPGSRKFLYIGHDGWQKNPRYLEQIAKMMPDQTISWMGSGKNLEGLKRLGRQDFGSAAARRLVASHDFVLTVGSFDANPSTILEAMSWGLIPVCTPTSGYSGYPGITNVPLDDPGEAVHILESLQQVPEAHLMSIQEANWQSLDTHFNWDRFSDQVLDAIRSDRSPSIHREGLGRKLRLRGSAVVSPQQEVSARLLARTARRALVNR
jgi:glycosyltransferase involved in cell wall biosynthesis